jgi:hypothetical protein
VGSWRVNVNVTNPAGFPSFPVMMTIHADGTMVQTRLGYIPFGPAGAVLEGTGHGAWQRVTGNQIAATFLTLIQGAPGNNILNGAFWASEKVNFRPVIGPDGNTFTANWSGTVTDTNGIVVLHGGGNMTAVRVQVE